MSIERELLERVVSGDDDGDFFISHRLYKDIETFLERTERTEQEPEAWMWTRNYEGGGYTNKVFEFLNDAEEYAKDSKTLKSPDIIRPLYTAPPKQPASTAEAVMPNGVRVSNVYDAYEEGRKSVMVKQEPVAWIYEWVDEAGEPVKSVAYNFYDDANPIPLYTAPPKREPLSEKEIREGNQSMLNVTREAFKQGVIFAEKAHGIGER